jgi:hypothetical protein
VFHARDWFDHLCADVEALDYAVGAAVLPAVAVGADHLRSQIYFAGDTDRHGQSGVRVHAEVARLPRRDGDARAVVPAHGLSTRMAQLLAFGNAIVPQVAQVFIEAYLDARGAC